ncbi:MAG: zinc metallopeptidase [Candidatus Eisenbacteria bacterium]|uniref:Zinc metallopeptidase n=1 Tax=Eiseniibacteriota bacterium TaxID=2212470 RepID=A0A956LVP2_UNCEI|nr:zinc metallopeptidase [Candidatus Eisenbacteria bacterium]
MFFDPMYLLIVGPAIVLSMITQFWVQSAFKKFSRVPVAAGLSGAEVAERIVAQAGLGVRVERVQGFLSDHYDPTHRVLRLSPNVFDRRSISSVGVAAHDAGHALQHAKNYLPLQWRSALVPITKVGTTLAWPLLLIGFLLGSLGLVKVGIIFFSAAVLFQVVTLPVEFDASRRAVAVIQQMGLVTTTEVAGVKKVLTAAAMTYVAAAAASIAQLLYFLMRAGLLGGRRD